MPPVDATCNATWIDVSPLLCQLDMTGGIPMDLKSFIKETLTQIIEGIDEARAVEGADGIASGRHVKQLNTAPGVMQDASGALYTAIDFDVAVTAIDGNEVGGGLRVAVAGIGAKKTSESQTVSRVKFTIPMRFKTY